jgi:S-DNA-T family DNA segregation ATPase FtsK/SpoIIIE
MAKKKKRKSSKKQIQVEREPNMFLRGVIAVLLFVAAFFLLIGGLGLGGALPVGLWNSSYKVFGLATLIAPLALCYWGYYKFKTEEHKIPISKIMSMTALLLLVSAWAHVAFATSTLGSDGGTVWVDGNGGAVGGALGGLGLAIFSKILASVVFFVLALLAACWVCNVSPNVFMAALGLFKRKEQDTDLESLKQNSTEKGFTLNEGVPVEHHTGRASLKNSAPKVLPKEENHKALTIVSDADWEFPPITLLNQKQDKADAGDVNGNADIIRETFKNFNYEIEVENANIGPRVTQFTIKAPTGVKLSKISALDDNLAYSLAAQSIRIEAPIPGQKAVGIEVPNLKAATVRISSVF